MRPLCPVSVTAVLALISLTACTATGGAGVNAAPLENFDPSQLRMLPDNPLDREMDPEIRSDMPAPRRG